MKATIEHNVTVTLEMTAEELAALRTAALNAISDLPMAESKAMEALYSAICDAQDQQ